MRRKDREVTGREEILAILHDCEVIRIGLCDDHQPYIVPMNFAYEVTEENLWIYLHCASQGKKIDIMKKNNRVCFEGDHSYQLVEREETCSWTALFKSVMGEGTIEILSEEEDKIHALDLLMKRHGFQGKPQYSPGAAAAVTALRITVTGITGKYKPS